LKAVRKSDHHALSLSTSHLIRRTATLWQSAQKKENAAPEQRRNA
jgi:hypothetical protein